MVPTWALLAGGLQGRLPKAVFLGSDKCTSSGHEEDNHRRPPTRCKCSSLPPRADREGTDRPQLWEATSSVASANRSGKRASVELITLLATHRAWPHVSL